MQNCKLANLLRFFPYDCNNKKNTFCKYYVEPSPLKKIRGYYCAYQISATLKELNKEIKIANRIKPTDKDSRLYNWRLKKRRTSKLYNWRKK